ncbi:MAG TPA: DUF5668 domain-containing protein [Terriglobales bacterium]|nr:DUF5668 domain-containing protein [Terriglobales bacterium]
MRYRYNSACSCARCRTHGLMGPVILITLGVLFLLDQMGRAHWMQFDFTWPALLIVIGLVMLLTHTASIEGHVPRQYGPAWQAPGQNYPAQPYPGQPGAAGAPPVVTPPAPPTAGFIAPSPTAKGPDDRGGA